LANYRHRNGGINFVTPHQRHNGDVLETCLSGPISTIRLVRKTRFEVTIHALLASTGHGLNQSTTVRNELKSATFTMVA